MALFRLSTSMQENNPLSFSGESANLTQMDLSFLPGFVWIILFIAAFVIFFAILYLTICLIVSVRGWRSYASEYRGPETFPASAQMFYGESMMIGGNIVPANYRHSITVGYNDEAIFLRVNKFLGPFHPPLLIPWTAVSCVEQKNAVKGAFTTVEVSEKSRLVFFRKLGDIIYAKWLDMNSKGKSAP